MISARSAGPEIDDFEVLQERFRVEPGKTLQEFLKRDQTWNRRSEPVPSLEAGTG